MPITPDEYRSRFARMQSAAAAELFDLVLVYTTGVRNMYGNLLYLTGYYSFDPCIQGALLAPSRGEPQLMLNFEWDLDRAALTSWLDRKAMTFDRDLAAGLIRYCGQHGFQSARIGLVGHTYLPLSLYQQLSAGLPEAQFIPATPLVEQLRAIKSPAEIEAMRRAATLTHNGIMAGARALKAGVSELEIVTICLHRMLAGGADEIAFTPQVSFGKMTEVCMAPASTNRLRRGNMVMFDMGCLYEHYLGDLSRTRVLGKPTAEQQRVYDLTLEAQDAAIAAVRPGIPAGEIDRIARDIIEKAGYGPAFNHWLGRGEGLDLHERPFIEKGDAMILQPGMVFSIEPGVYVPGLGGARVEETMLVTETGHEVISDMSHRDWVV
jgi:Xaa-Pro dipeptidase